MIVNNAGITRDATMKKMNRNAWDEVLDTNLGGCFNMCKAAWDGMLNRSFGRIVNIGSINGQAGQYGQVNYAAAKSGIHGFTKALARKAPPRASPSTPSRRAISTPTWWPRCRPKCWKRSSPAFRSGGWARPHEIARGVLFLVADEARLHHRLDHVDQWRPAYVLRALPLRRGFAAAFAAARPGAHRATLLLTSQNSAR